MSEANEREAVESLDIEQIIEAIPHRYPFLMIDRILAVVPDESALGLKNVSINEHYFQGHFPRRPVMPGVLIVEAMAGHPQHGVLTSFDRFRQQERDAVHADVGEGTFQLAGVELPVHLLFVVFRRVLLAMDADHTFAVSAGKRSAI